MQGQDGLMGEPTWTIFDPIGYRYFQIDHRTFDLLVHWSIGKSRALIEKIEDQRGYRPKPEDIDNVIRFLRSHSLVGYSSAGSWRGLLDKKIQAKGKSWHWVTHKYLFFRIPLFRPERFLEAISIFAEPFFTRVFWIILLLAGFLALYLVDRRWADFTDTIYRFATFDSIYYYALILVFVKSAHELAHGLTAIRYGCRVPTMGVAFMVLYPLFYTDVSDAWRLTDKLQRVRIGIAGVLAELIIAVVATLLWVFTPDGIARNLLFFLATSSWLLSITVNLNPFMRFDGYYVLSDWLGVANLGPRSFALGKWWLRRCLFGVNAPPPEAMPRRMRRFLILYAYSTWIYRLVFFLAIAVMIYALMPKVLGVPLLGAEIFVFILMPIIRECLEWWKMRKEIARNSRTWLTVSACAVLIGLLFYPLQSSVTAPAVFDGFGRTEIYSNQPARLSKIHAERGDFVRQGDLLFEFENPALEWEEQQSMARLELIDLKLGRRTADQRDLAQSMVLQQQRLVEMHALAGIAELKEELVIRAPYDGFVIELNPELHAGRWLPDGATLAALGGQDAARIIGSVDGPALARIIPEGEAYFLARDPAYERIPVALAQIDEVASRTLSEPYLSSAFGGEVPVEVDASGAHKTTRAHFILNFQLVEPIEVDRILRGSIHLEAKPESYFQIILRRVLEVVIWESRV